MSEQLILNGLPFIVSDSAYDTLPIKGLISGVHFSDFTPNPNYEDVLKGVDAFKRGDFGVIVAIGGGSTIDVAKCIKKYAETKIPLIAVPTTAGTGAESTSFAVVYRDGVKISVNCELPAAAILVPSLLKTLPLYQKKCTFLDALCHSLESWWNINATDESISYAKKAIDLLLSNMDGYIFENNDYANVLLGANYAGRAINITATTAPHAMSYKLTSLYGIPHGHAVAVCFAAVWEYMKDKKDFGEITRYAGEVRRILDKFEISPPKDISDSDIDLLTQSVNQERLQNNPVSLNAETIKLLYKGLRVWT